MPRRPPAVRAWAENVLGPRGRTVRAGDTRVDWIITGGDASGDSDTIAIGRMNEPNSATARWFGVLGWALTILASSGVLAVMHWGAGVFSDRYASTAIAGPYSALVLWCGIPLGLATIACVAVLAGKVRFMLPPIGAMALLTIGAGFSVGPFFVPPTALLLVAALLHLSERGNRWMLAMSWLWLLVGAAALLPFLALLTTLHGLPTTLSTGIPFFGVTVLALVVCEGVHAYHLRRRLPDPRIL
jgi:hypothetical protein